jgi:Tfp pilus assembly protein PilO
MTVSIRIWGLASGAAAVALLAGGWFIGVQPQLATADAASQAAAGVDQQNQATQIKIMGLTKAAAKVDAMKAEDAVLLKSVPRVLKPNTFIRRVGEVAALDGVTVVSVTSADAVPYAQPASAATAGAVGATGLPVPVLAKTNPLITPANLVVVPVTVVVSGGADSVLQFAHDIQNDERTFSISGLQNTRDDDSSEVTSSLSGYIYTLKR